MYVCVKLDRSNRACKSEL